MKITLHTALITGSSRGFGRAIAVKLAQEGVKKIAVHYLTRRDEAEKTLSQVRDAGAEGVLVQGDTSDAKRAAEIVEEAAEKLGGCEAHGWWRPDSRDVIHTGSSDRRMAAVGRHGLRQGCSRKYVQVLRSCT